MVLTDTEIIHMLENALLNTGYRLVSFNRNHGCFGNMIVVIEGNRVKYQFVTDRDDILCNNTMIIPHDYHVAGKDDCPQYLIEAIKKFIS